MSQEDEGVSITALLELLNGGESNFEFIQGEEVEEVNAEVKEPVENLNFELDLQCKEEQAYPELHCTVKSDQTLNTRGMPVRKRNAPKTYCYDEPDDEDFKIKPSRRLYKSRKNRLPPIAEQQKSSISKNVTTCTSNKFLSAEAFGMKVGTRLKNVLKLPKSFRWVYCEWFYSDIDKCIFSNNYNDFEVCLKTNFPSLKTRMMTRTEWTIIRRSLGKRLRCSDAFFQEERKILENLRKKIRYVQQCKKRQIPCCQDLPLKIPLMLVVGDKATARLHKPRNGIFDGIISSFDYSNNTYRISFEQSLEIHSVPDYEVFSNATQIFINKDNQFYGNKMSGVKRNFQSINEVTTIPQDLLVKIVFSKKMLAEKEKLVKLLSTMNRELEISTAFETPISEDFEQKYALVLEDLENINRQLKINLNEISLFVQRITSKSSMPLSHLREKCKEEILKIVQQMNNEKQTIDADNTKLLELVSEIRYLMQISKTLADRDKTTNTLQDLQDSLENLKEKFRNDEELLLSFSHNIEVNFKHILMLLSENCNAV